MIYKTLSQKNIEMETAMKILIGANMSTEMEGVGTKIRRIERKCTNIESDVSTTRRDINVLDDRFDDHNKKIGDAQEEKCYNRPTQSSSMFGDTSTVGDDKASGGQEKFMNTYDISVSKDKHPILIPFQFLYPKNNQNPRDIETYTFQKNQTGSEMSK